MFYAWCNFTFILNIKQQSHKQESKMLIEHTNRSIEDKPKIHLTWSTKYMCCGALRRSTGCFNQQSLYTVSQLEYVTQPSRTTLYQSTQSQQKSTLSQSMVNAKTSTKGQCNLVKVNIQPRFMCQKMRLQKSEFWESLGSVWPCVDQSQPWSNLRWNPRSKQKSSFTEISHMWEKKSLQGDRTNQMMRENVWWCDEWKWSPTLTYIYIHQWGCVTHLLGLQAYISILVDLAHKWN